MTSVFLSVMQTEKQNLELASVLSSYDYGPINHSIILFLHSCLLFPIPIATRLAPSYVWDTLLVNIPNSRVVSFQIILHILKTLL